jgi:hypothetical protein
LHDGDTLVLCTEGVWSTVDEGDVAVAGNQACLSDVIGHVMSRTSEDVARALMVIRVRRA